MIPENTNRYSAFIKLPNPLKDSKGEIEENDAVKVTTEFKPPTNEKIKSFLVGEVQLVNGETRTVGLNMTSYYNIAKVFGEDTFEWIDKEIIFCGFKTLGKGNGFLWSAS